MIRDDEGRLLLIKRGHEPGAGLWSLPGGRIEPGETDTEALVREMREETGLTVKVGRRLGSVRRPGLGGDVIDISDYAATIISGRLTPDDDAADARWVDTAELESMAITDGLVEALTEWGVLGQGPHYRPISCSYRPRVPLVLSGHFYDACSVYLVRASLDGGLCAFLCHPVDGPGARVAVRERWNHGSFGLNWPGNRRVRSMKP